VPPGRFVSVERSVEERQEAVRRGARAEARVGALLEEQGWEVLARNWRGGGGELDIVVGRDGALRVVEVKCRAVDDLHGPEVALGPTKRRRLVRAAEAFLAQYDDLYDECCFLLAWVEGGRITLIDDAFDA
jgi:putative endonuclease